MSKKKDKKNIKKACGKQNERKGRTKNLHGVLTQKRSPAAATSRAKHQKQLL